MIHHHFRANQHMRQSERGDPGSCRKEAHLRHYQTAVGWWKEDSPVDVGPLHMVINNIHISFKNVVTATLRPDVWSYVLLSFFDKYLMNRTK